MHSIPSSLSQVKLHTSHSAQDTQAEISIMLAINLNLINSSYIY